jgi:hypothetical protein
LPLAYTCRKPAVRRGFSDVPIPRESNEQYSGTGCWLFAAGYWLSAVDPSLSWANLANLANLAIFRLTG